MKTEAWKFGHTTIWGKLHPHEKHIQRFRIIIDITASMPVPSPAVTAAWNKEFNPREGDVTPTVLHNLTALPPNRDRKCKVVECLDVLKIVTLTKFLTFIPAMGCGQVYNKSKGFRSNCKLNFLLKIRQNLFTALQTQQSLFCTVVQCHETCTLVKSYFCKAEDFSSRSLIFELRRSSRCMKTWVCRIGLSQTEMN
jgi:hypothetical protein